MISGVWGCFGGVEGKQGHKEILGVDGYIHCLDCGDGFMGIYTYTHQNLSDYTF